MSDAMVCCKDPTVRAACSCAELLVPDSEQAAGANTLKDVTLISSLSESVLPSGAGLMRCRQDGGQGWKNPSWRRMGRAERNKMLPPSASQRTLTFNVWQKSELYRSSL